MDDPGWEPAAEVGAERSVRDGMERFVAWFRVVHTSSVQHYQHEHEVGAGVSVRLLQTISWIDEAGAACAGLSQSSAYLAMVGSLVD
jgi:hypothetical protein